MQCWAYFSRDTTFDLNGDADKWLQMALGSSRSGYVADMITSSTVGWGGVRVVGHSAESQSHQLMRLCIYRLKPTDCGHL
jgi:hypothetical protein